MSAESPQQDEDNLKIVEDESEITISEPVPEAQQVEEQTEQIEQNEQVEEMEQVEEVEQVEEMEQVNQEAEVRIPVDVVEDVDMDCEEDEEEEEEKQVNEVENREEDDGNNEEEEEEDEEVYDEEAIQKSNVQKESFLEMFRIAPTVRDILPDLQAFVNHPDVIKPDKREVERLVEKKIEDERAKKKAQKASKKEKEKVVPEKPAVDLAQAIRNVTGLDLAGILKKTAQNQQTVPPPVVPNVQFAETINLVPPPIQAPLVAPIVPAVTLPPEITTAPLLNLGSSAITAVRVGKAGFSTPHPVEKARKTTMADVAPIPEALKNLVNHNKPLIPAIPNELLPPDQRVPVISAPAPAIYVISRPPIRKTLLMAGARAGKRSERLEALAGDDKKKKNEDSRKNTSVSQNRPNTFKNNQDRRGARSGGFGGGSGGNRSGGGGYSGGSGGYGGGGVGGGSSSGSNALPTTLNKNTPISVRRYRASQLAKEKGITYDEAMDQIEEQCGQFSGDEEAKEADEEVMETIRTRGDRRFNERNNYVPVDHSNGIPGVDRPPCGGRIDRDRDMSRDRELGKWRDQRDFERDKGRRGRKRGGIKEREKQRRKDDRRDYGRGRNQWDDDRGRRDYGGPPNKYGRYDDQQGQEKYDDYNTYHQESGAYDGNQHYEGYYEGQEGEGYGNYDQTAAADYSNYDYYGAQQDQQQEGYYQEDGSQYYNEYYGTTDAPQEEYQATYENAAPAPPAPE